MHLYFVELKEFRRVFLLSLTISLSPLKIRALVEARLSPPKPVHVAAGRLAQLTALATQVLEQVLRDDKANAAPRVTAAAKVWEIVNRARELGDIESRLAELERIAGARSSKTVRIG